MIGSSALGDSTSSVARNTSTIGSPSQLPATPPVRIAAAIAIHASPSVIASIRMGTKTSVMRLTSRRNFSYDHQHLRGVSQAEDLTALTSADARKAKKISLQRS